MGGTAYRAPFRAVLAVLVAALGVAGIALPPRAAQGAAEAAAPASRLELGIEARLRTENWENLADFDDRATVAGDVRHQVRYRGRAWSRLVLTRAEIMLGLCHESRTVTTPDTPFAWDETIVENLYLDYRFDDRLSARIGRQNLTRGDLFLLADGGPLDGSRALYVNALDVVWKLGASRLELIAISDPHRDVYLPPIHDQRKTLIEWDERAAGVYLTGGGAARTRFEACWFYKTETDDVRPASHPAHQPDRSLHLLGGRWGRRLDRGWSLNAELAGEAGTQDPDTDLRAWAGTGAVRKEFGGAASPSLSLAWIGLSGDDPATTRIEGWDPLFARWPKWSELYLYTLATEHGPAYWTNLGAWQAELLMKPAPGLDLRATYYRLTAPHAHPGDPGRFGSGGTRGDLFQVRADLKLNDRLRGHLLGEWLEPGSFYAGSDPAWFFRAEVICGLGRTLAL